MNAAVAILAALLALCGLACPAGAQGQAEMDAVRSVVERAREAGAGRFDPGTIRSEDREALKNFAGVRDSAVRSLGAAAHAAPAPVAVTPVERPASNERSQPEDAPPPAEPAEDAPGGLADDPQAPDLDAGVMKRGDRERAATRQGDQAAPEKAEPDPSSIGSMPRVVHIPRGRPITQTRGDAGRPVASLPPSPAGRAIPTLGAAPGPAPAPAVPRASGGFEELRAQPRPAATVAEPPRTGGFGSLERAAPRAAQR